jgi:hypothetical protein
MSSTKKQVKKDKRERTPEIETSKQNTKVSKTITEKKESEDVTPLNVQASIEQQLEKEKERVQYELLNHVIRQPEPLKVGYDELNCWEDIVIEKMVNGKKVIEPNGVWVTFEKKKEDNSTETELKFQPLGTEDNKGPYEPVKFYSPMFQVRFVKGDGIGNFSEALKMTKDQSKYSFMLRELDSGTPVQNFFDKQERTTTKWGENQKRLIDSFECIHNAMLKKAWSVHPAKTTMISDELDEDSKKDPTVIKLKEAEERAYKMFIRGFGKPYDWVMEDRKAKIKKMPEERTITFKIPCYGSLNKKEKEILPTIKEEIKAAKLETDVRYMYLFRDGEKKPPKKYLPLNILVPDDRSLDGLVPIYDKNEENRKKYKKIDPRYNIKEWRQVEQSQQIIFDNAILSLNFQFNCYNPFGDVKSLRGTTTVSDNRVIEHLTAPQSNKQQTNPHKRNVSLIEEMNNTNVNRENGVDTGLNLTNPHANKQKTSTPPL